MHACTHAYKAHVHTQAHTHAHRHMCTHRHTSTCTHRTHSDSLRPGRSGSVRTGGVTSTNQHMAQQEALDPMASQPSYWASLSRESAFSCPKRKEDPLGPCRPKSGASCGQSPGCPSQRTTSHIRGSTRPSLTPDDLPQAGQPELTNCLQEGTSFSPLNSRGGRALGQALPGRNHPAHTSSLDSGLQTWGSIDLCCFKPPGLWYFVTAAPGH